VGQNGAEYHGDLTKAVTHLIVANPSGKKYEHAVNWKMNIVSLEWFEQSLQRGMVLDESRYNPTLPVEERGKGAWDRIQARTPVIGKRTRDVDQGQAMNPLKRKLRRSASTKFGTQSDALWAGITSASFTPDRNEEDDWKDDAPGPHQTTPRGSTPTAHAKEFLSHHANVKPEAHAAAEPAETDTTHADAGTHAGIFQGRIVVPHAFDQEKVGSGFVFARVCATNITARQAFCESISRTTVRACSASMSSITLSQTI
jgi:DNA replication regulator DPB11